MDLILKLANSPFATIPFASLFSLLLPQLSENAPDNEPECLDAERTPPEDTKPELLPGRLEEEVVDDVHMEADRPLNEDEDDLQPTLEEDDLDEDEFDELDAEDDEDELESSSSRAAIPSGTSTRYSLIPRPPASNIGADAVAVPPEASSPPSRSGGGIADSYRRTDNEPAQGGLGNLSTAWYAPGAKPEPRLRASRTRKAERPAMQAPRAPLPQTDPDQLNCVQRGRRADDARSVERLGTQLIVLLEGSHDSD